MDYSSTQYMFINKLTNWEKIGLIIKPIFNSKWMVSHTAVPFAQPFSKSVIKIYFCIRDKLNKSQITNVYFDLIKNKIIRNIKKKPILTNGELGTFDENGVTPSWFLNIKNKNYLYYVGWGSSKSTRMQLFAGLAISKKNNDIFKKVSRSPILERNKVDPFLTATLCVLKDKNIFRMWYVSGDKWTTFNKEIYPKYNIKYADSKDGINWQRKGLICIDYKNKYEYALARPSVIKINGEYHMWYSYKQYGNEYNIGYAISKDGFSWKRVDQCLGLEKGKKGSWDSEMLAYAHVFFYKKNLFMLYNGNQYGKTGIGIAKLQQQIL
jgi:predicted GH43/DUF377 family glycosyl hydrolase